MKNLTVENVYIRHNAKLLAKTHFWKLLGMMAVAFAIPTAVLTILSSALTSLTASQPELYMALNILLSLAVSLGSTVLMLGALHAMIQLCRGDEDVTVGTVFSRMGFTLKAFGLSLWVGLKTILWMLPGYVLLFAAIIASASVLSSEDSAIVMVLMMLGALVLIGAFAIPAAYRYMMSTYILADKPETGVFECVRQSKAMMKGHKWQAFKLIVPIFLVMYVIMLVVAVAIGAVNGLVANSPALVNAVSIVMFIAIFAVALYYMIRMHLCYALFYLKRVEEQQPAEDDASAE